MALTILSPLVFDTRGVTLAWEDLGKIYQPNYLTKPKKDIKTTPKLLQNILLLENVQEEAIFFRKAFLSKTIKEGLKKKLLLIQFSPI